MNYTYIWVYIEKSILITCLVVVLYVRWIYISKHFYCYILPGIFSLTFIKWTLWSYKRKRFILFQNCVIYENILEWTLVVAIILRFFCGGLQASALDAWTSHLWLLDNRVLQLIQEPEDVMLVEPCDIKGYPEKTWKWRDL